MARYGKGVDAERIMMRWKRSDVVKLIRALSALVERESPKHREGD